MVSKLKKRNDNQVYTSEESHSMAFFYQRLVGRIILKVLCHRYVSKLGGLYLSSKHSKSFIKLFIKNNEINMEDYEEVDYQNFNEFFSRQIKANKRKIGKDFISPCDSLLTVYNISKDSIFNIKNSYYSISDLIKNKELANKYDGGYALIFRLTVKDYHRYCYIDNGHKDKNNFIKGVLHTVRPISMERYRIFKQNAREWTILHTKNYGDVIHIEVGAIAVGKIINHHQTYNFTKGEEKGYFQFGGSTIILLVEKEKIIIDNDILENSLNDIETVVKLGENIAKKIN